MTYLLSEDKALRELLQGVTVNDQKADGTDTPRPVGVWFGQPDQELRTQAYPYITIDMIDIDRDAQREMRGTTSAAYLLPADLTLEENTAAEMDLPIPVNIDYQITTYSRHPRHDRQLLAILQTTRLPFRFGALSLDDGTVRRLDVIDVAKRDAVEQAKRLFMNVFTVRVSSEIPLRAYKIVHKVLEVHVEEPTEERAGGRASSVNYSGIGSFTISS